MDRITVLQYCCDALARRASVGDAQAWFWALRRKVALYCLGVELSQGQPEDENRRRLTEDEERSILSKHPLLAQQSPLAPSSVAAPGKVWMEESRQRARSYLDSLTKCHKT
jgi:hypothetical protein